MESRKAEQTKYGIFFDDGYDYMKHLRSLNEEASMVNMKISSDISEVSSGDKIDRET